MNRSPGTYVLLIELAMRRRIGIGRLGVIEFQPGFYAYVGSAMGGLESRIARHKRPPSGKRPHWHIDHFLGTGVIMAVYVKAGSQRMECFTACTLGKEFAGIAGFGCSDCRCPSHLFYHPDAQPLIALLENEPLRFIL